MAETIRLKLPLIDAAQAQKHVTHNEALVLLDLLTGIIPVLDRDLDTPPSGESDGDVYILGGAGSGDWAGYAAGDLALRLDGAWRRVIPSMGMLAAIGDEGGALAYFDGAAWGAAIGGGVTVPTLGDGSIVKVGINTGADNTNRLAVKSDAVLLSHDDVTPGSGSMQAVLNKAADANDAGFVFQDNWSTRALFGLLGSDDFTLKVSPDGGSFFDALVVDRGSGAAYFPTAVRLGGNAAANELKHYEEGTWTPALGSIVGGDLAGATGITPIYANYTKVGRLVTLHFAFTVDGVSATDFSQKSSISITGLPFVPANLLASGVDQGGAHGFVYRSIGSALDTLLGGGVSDAGGGTLYLFAFYTGNAEARLTDPFFVTASYVVA